MGHEMPDKIELDIEMDNDRACRVRAVNLMTTTTASNDDDMKNTKQKQIDAQLIH